MKFDPATCKGDMHQELTSHVRQLGVGDRVEMPDGVKVAAKKSNLGGPAQRIFDVHGHEPTDQSTHQQAAPAAEAALTYSARSTHPDSVGGEQSFRSYKAFAKKRSY